ncbi:MAG: TIGR01777 family oxidoreductase [Myxococcota bacterium]|nr:TIGR01777 family oxidoreductase [Myxococcota bacterium]
MKSTFTKSSFFSVPKQVLFEFHERDDAFSVLTPEEEKIEVYSTASTLAPSEDVVRFAVNFLVFKFQFENVHTVYEPFDRFVDEQKKGLFSLWRHEHRFVEAGWQQDPAAMLIDEITYAHPLLPAFNPFVKHKLGQLFAYRHATTGKYVQDSKASTETPTKTVAVTGATGLIGKRIVQILVEKGMRVVALVRNVNKASKALGSGVTCVHWDFTKPEQGEWKEALTAADGVIHLAGTPLFKQRWTPAFKREMEQSRVQGTRQLVDAIAGSAKKPGVFISASAMGIYGTDPTRSVDEGSATAEDLLARICLNWEDESKKLDTHGVRTVQMRIGIALSTESGALKELLPLFRTGLGGTMGSPDHYINWIHIEDVARMFVMALENQAMQGPYNAVGPRPVKNAGFAQAIARALNRPSVMSFPTSMLKVMIGEAGEYASGGPKASCKRIQDAGYRFFFNDIDSALNHLLSNS